MYLRVLKISSRDVGCKRYIYIYTVFQQTSWSMLIINPYHTLRTSFTPGFRIKKRNRLIHVDWWGFIININSTDIQNFAIYELTMKNLFSSWKYPSNHAS